MPSINIFSVLIVLVAVALGCYLRKFLPFSEIIMTKKQLSKLTDRLLEIGSRLGEAKAKKTLVIVDEKVRINNHSSINLKIVGGPTEKPCDCNECESSDHCPGYKKDSTQEDKSQDINS